MYRILNCTFVNTLQYEKVMYLPIYEVANCFAPTKVVNSACILKTNSMYIV